MAALPRSAPASRMLWSLDRRGWVALAFEDVDGSTQPALATRRTPPGPGDGDRHGGRPHPGTPTTTSIADRLGESFAGWRRLPAAWTGWP